ncbi:MAG TPA: GNAT family N-acetyltransferase [Candidatus Mcinerneyibacteriales bacterium]|nr:GNAT family N-acetyltransferase [Candidatus Mcinerneyibacteriales bacterium]
MTGKERLDLNISGYSFFLNNTPVKTFSLGQTEVLLGESDHLWAYIFSASSQELSSLLPEIMGETLYFAAVEEWVIALLKKKRRVEWALKTDRFLFPEKGRVEAPELPVDHLRREDAETIFAESGYQAYTDVSYIRERILSGPAVCIRKGGELAAWAMTHDDGALGLLQVRPSWRREHLAENLVRYLVREKQRRKEPLFLNIEPGNKASQALALKIGFRKEKVIFWVKLGEECSPSSD